MFAIQSFINRHFYTQSTKITTERGSSCWEKIGTFYHIRLSFWDSDCHCHTLKYSKLLFFLHLKLLLFHSILEFDLWTTSRSVSWAGHINCKIRTLKNERGTSEFKFPCFFWVETWADRQYWDSQSPEAEDEACVTTAQDDKFAVVKYFNRFWPN